MQIKVINKSENFLPKRQTIDSVGYDVYSNEDATIQKGETLALSTGLFVEVPLGFELQVRSRSGLALNHGLHVLNSPGCIDPDFRGEVKVILHNSGKMPYRVTKGERIAQFILVPIFTIQWQEVEKLTTTDREGGFGSTG